MKRALLCGSGCLVLVLPVTGSACEPILPLAQLLSSASAAGPVVFTQSLFWLLMAIGIKSIAFSCFEKRLFWGRAVFFMLVANIVSTIPGGLIAVSAASSPIGGLFFALPVVGALGLIIHRRVMRLPPSPWQSRISGVAIMVAFVLFYVASMFLYGFTQVLLKDHNYANYWIVKFLFVALVACTGIVISAVLEEGVIAQLSRKRAGDVSFYTPVIRANYITLGVILLVAAVVMMPQRLRSSNFLTRWLDPFCAALGLT